MRKLILAAAAIGLLGSCHPRILTVQTEYLSHENLASFHVGTPDPRLKNPTLGQKLIVNWSIPHWSELTPYELSIKIRFKNGTSAEETIPVCRASGTYVYALLNEDYFSRGGFKTYVASITFDGVIIDEWRHQLWATVIEIPENDGYDDDDDDDEAECVEPETDQEIYDAHYKGAGGIQKPIEDATDPTQAEYKYYF